MRFSNANSKQFALRSVAAALLTAGSLCAQVVNVPREPLPIQNGDPTMKVFDMQHLKDVPYNGSLPKPIFPSTERVQRAFIEEFVYDYAYSAYKPEVSIPIVSPLQAKRETPEDALIAFFAAIRTGDYEAFVKSWDDTMQADLRARAKDQNQGAAYWQNVWKQMFGNKPVVLVDRIETLGYVILDARFNTPTQNAPFPTVFKLVNKQWLATNDLQTSAILDNLPPKLAGEIIRVQPIPVNKFTPDQAQQKAAQDDFLRSHTLRDTSVHVGH